MRVCVYVSVCTCVSRVFYIYNNEFKRQCNMNNERRRFDN